MRCRTLEELQKLPTLCVGQVDNLKIETPTMRVWLSRVTVADGQPYDNQVTIERLGVNGIWCTDYVYEAK